MQVTPYGLVSYAGSQRRQDVTLGFVNKVLAKMGDPGSLNSRQARNRALESSEVGWLYFRSGRLSLLKCFFHFGSEFMIDSLLGCSRQRAHLSDGGQSDCNCAGKSAKSPVPWQMIKLSIRSLVVSRRPRWIFHAISQCFSSAHSNTAAAGVMRV